MFFMMEYDVVIVIVCGVVICMFFSQIRSFLTFNSLTGADGGEEPSIEDRLGKLETIVETLKVLISKSMDWKNCGECKKSEDGKPKKYCGKNSVDEQNNEGTKHDKKCP